ncbi:hypothetical protein MY3957_002560, partial [Beauveria namnaoensis]
MIVSLSSLRPRQEQVPSLLMNKMPTPNSSPQCTRTAGSPRRRSPPCCSPSPFVSVLLAALLETLAQLLETLAQKSAADGALCLVDAAADIPRIISFAHFFVCFGCSLLCKVAVFGTAPVLSSPKVNMTYPLRPHGPSLAGHRPHSAKPFLNRGYAITWLDQDLPAFTTPQYALHLFSPLPSLAPLAGQRADKLDRSCRRPPPRNGPVKMSFLDGRGCNATNIVPHPGISPSAAPLQDAPTLGTRTAAWADQFAPRAWLPAAPPPGTPFSPRGAVLRGADLRVRAEAYTSVHKMLFSVAYAQLLVDMLPPPPPPPKP